MGMRLVVAAVVAFVVMGAAHAQEGLFQRDHGKVAPPEVVATSSRPAPPEGVGPGGLDFGPWRGASTQAYGEAMRARIAARTDGKLLSVARADLEANGFSCVEARERSPQAPALECRIQTTDRGCAVEWWAVREDPVAPVKAGYDVMCPRR
jgi:hypothetical protein